MALTFASVSGNSPLYYIAVVLTNSQTGATAANLPVKVTLNSSTNSTLMASTLRNANWQDGAGNILKSWLESGETNASTASVYWINLGANTIAGSGGTFTVYLAIYGLAIDAFNATNTGAEPNFTGTYGQFDTGAVVFSFYDNFAGSTLAGSWTTDTNTTRTVSNGLTMFPAGGQWWSIYNSATLPVPGIIESLMSQAAAAYGAIGTTNASTTISGAGNIAFEMRSAASQWGVEQPGGTAGTYAGTANTGTVYLVTGQAVAATNSLLDVAYANVVTRSCTPVTGRNVMLGAFPNGTNTTKFQWVRTRLYPPSGVLPSVGAGSPVSLAGVSPRIRHPRRARRITIRNMRRANPNQLRFAPPVMAPSGKVPSHRIRRIVLRQLQRKRVRSLRAFPGPSVISDRKPPNSKRLRRPLKVQLRRLRTRLVGFSSVPVNRGFLIKARLRRIARKQTLPTKKRGILARLATLAFKRPRVPNVHQRKQPIKRVQRIPHFASIKAAGFGVFAVLRRLRRQRKPVIQKHAAHVSRFGSLVTLAVGLPPRVLRSRRSKVVRPNLFRRIQRRLHIKFPSIIPSPPIGGMHARFTLILGDSAQKVLLLQAGAMTGTFQLAAEPEFKLKTAAPVHQVALLIAAPAQDIKVLVAA